MHGHFCLGSKILLLLVTKCENGHAAVHTRPPCPTIQMAREEAEMVMFESVRQVLAAGGVSACQARPRSASWHHMLLFRIDESCVTSHPSHLAIEAIGVCYFAFMGQASECCMACRL